MSEYESTNVEAGKTEPESVKKRGVFPQQVYDRMPVIFKDGLTVLTDEIEKAVYLMGSLGIMSGLLPNVQGVYDGRIVYPNLFIYLLGPYGSGKGSLSYVREIGEAVHQDKIQKAVEQRERYLVELIRFNADLKTWKKNRQGNPPEKPKEPGTLMHFIPANNSKTGLFELLKENNGFGTICETEGDTLADALRQDYGNFSDGLRKSFHHEPISFYRRGNKEFVEITKPKLSIVLSSTFDQFLKLIPTVENGLYSRFCYFTLPSQIGFKDVFDSRKSSYLSVFQDIGVRVKNYYDSQNAREEPISFDLLESQKKSLLNDFNHLKEDVHYNISEDLGGTVNRLGLIFFRLAMIITTCRQLETSHIDNQITCSDDDYFLTKQIVEVLITQSIKVYKHFPPKTRLENKPIREAEQIIQAKKLREQGLPLRQISMIVTGKDSNQSKISRWTAV